MSFLWFSQEKIGFDLVSRKMLCLYIPAALDSRVYFELRLFEFLPRVPHLLRTQRQLQFEADINKLFMYTRLVLLSQYYGDGAEEIIEMAGKTSLSEQQRQV
ncbi:BnaC02g41730D [Brassica napus]|uniref:(rape) hypothetical protein n=1 Tax=Brassica napus TaxID=3708 RepID=A0A078HTY4_BRANA|nr:unnamed protein product [Brassica napus]CDY40804.1 BnaC02g41730D [Brassica napus]